MGIILKKLNRLKLWKRENLKFCGASVIISAGVLNYIDPFTGGYWRQFPNKKQQLYWQKRVIANREAERKQEEYDPKKNDDLETYMILKGLNILP